VSTGLFEYLPLPNNSITVNRIDNVNAKDFQEVFSFYDFIQNLDIRLNSSQYHSAYKNYLNIWNEVKKGDEADKIQLIKDRYVELLKDISLNYLTYEERKFLSLADFSNPLDLDIIIPLYSRKIIDICKYHSDKREKTKHSAYKNQERGTIHSIEHAIHDSVTDYVFIGDDENLIDNLPALKIEEIINTLDIEIEELIDVYTTYLDNDPSLDASAYNVKSELRKKLFLANANDINENIFLNFDKAITEYIFQVLSIFFKETGRAFTINYDISKVDINCDTGDKLYDLVTKYKTYAQNILDLKGSLIKKFIGTDFYYIQTGETINDIAAGKLFEAENPSGNLLNRRFPSTATVEEESQLQTLRKMGLFFRPEKLGLLYFSVPKNHYEIDYSKLEPNKLYIFPDPSRYGNTSGLTNNYYKEYPLIHTQDYTPIIKNISNGFADGDIATNAKDQNFFGYIAKNQIAASKITNKSSLDLNFLSLHNKGKISRWGCDIYGNEFVLLEKTEFKNYTDTRTTINESITTFESYDGGVMLFDDNTQLPVLCSSDTKQWPGSIFSSVYYYNVLLDAGIGGILDGIMIRPIKAPTLYDGLSYTIPENALYEVDLCYDVINWPDFDLLLDCGLYTDQTIYEASFSYNYVLSSIQYKLLDGGNIIQNETYSEFDSTRNIFLSELQEGKETTTLSSLSSLDYKEIYVKNIRDRTILNITQACSALYKKFNYEQTLSGELIYNIVDFNVYTDILYIKTKNFAIFEKYKFDGKFYSANTPTNILSGNLSDPFFFENKSFALMCDVEILTSNDLFGVQIVPHLYKIYYSDTHIEYINYTLNSSLSSDAFKNKIQVSYTRVSRPTITYNSRNKIYAICCTLYDGNNVPYIYQIFLNFDEIQATILKVNLISLMEANSYKTVDIYNNEHISIFNFTKLNNQCVIAVNPEDRCLDFYG
jgi:hypothetical protein